MRSFRSKLNRQYVDDLTNPLRYLKSTICDGSAYDSIGVFGVESVVAKTLDQMLCEEGIEA